MNRKYAHKLPQEQKSRWFTVSAYFCVILCVGLIGTFFASTFLPNAELSAPTSGTTGFRAHLALGALLAMFLCPMWAGFRHWDVLSYLIASTLALGFLFGNVGFGIPLSLFSTILLYGTQRLCLLLSYFNHTSPGK